jgi:enoyl-CoA hydratase
MRNTPEAQRFIELAATDGVDAAVAHRDGPFADYSHAPPERKPRPSNVLDAEVSDA